MASVKVRPIVVPRSWDGNLIHFAVVFNFAENDDEVFQGSTAFKQWPTTLRSLGWLASVPPMRQKLDPADAARVSHVEIARVGVSPGIDPSRYGVARAPMPSESKAQAAWSAIFGDFPGKSRATRPRGSLVKLFKDRPLPEHFRANPTGSSDLRPVQRLESLETPQTERLLSNANLHRALLDASAHDLAVAKITARNYHTLFTKLSSELRVGEMPTSERLERIFASHADRVSAFDLQFEQAHDKANLGMRSYLAFVADEAAGIEGPRLKRSLEQARNRPSGTITRNQATNPSVPEILARLQKHPGVMERLGLVMQGVAWFDDLAPNSTVTGTISLKVPTANLGDIEVESTSTHFELLAGSDPKSPFRGLSYFRAAERVPGELDDRGSSWKLFHITPPSFFEVSQEDCGRALIRAQLGSAAGDSQTSNQLIDSIAIKASPQNKSVAEDLLKKLTKASRSPQGVAVDTGLYAEDLMVGHTFDVAVQPENRMRPGIWHSLCQRRVVVTRKGTSEPLIDCLEDGYVSTSVTTAAPPIVGAVTRLASLAPPPALQLEFDQYNLQLDRLGAYNAAGDDDNKDGYLIVAPGHKKRNAGSKALPFTQLRSAFRDETRIEDIAVIGGADADHVHLVIGPTPVAGKSTFVDSLYLSPVFSSSALADAGLSTTNVNFFEATSTKRNETFEFAFAGGITSFLAGSGTVTAAWPPKFKEFEVEGERRAFVRRPSDLAVLESIGGLASSDGVNGIFSDSLPFAWLTQDHARAFGGPVSSVPVPFMPVAVSQSISAPRSGNYPMRFLFRGAVSDLLQRPGDSTELQFGIKDVRFQLGAAAVPLSCSKGIIVNRDGIRGQAPKEGDLMVGTGEVASPDGPFRITRLEVLGPANSTYGEAAAARNGPFACWQPRLVRIDAPIRRVLGPLSGRPEFQCRGQISSVRKDFDKQEAFEVTIKGLQLGDESIQILVPSSVARQPATDQIMSASGILAEVDIGGARQTACIIRRWATFDPMRQRAEADATSKNPGFEWVFNVVTSTGDRRIAVDASSSSSAPVRVHSPKGVALAALVGEQPWVDALCLPGANVDKCLGRPGWVSGSLVVIRQVKSAQLTLVDGDSLRIDLAQVPAESGKKIGYFRLSGPRTTPTCRLDEQGFDDKDTLVLLVGEVLAKDVGQSVVLSMAALTGETRWQLVCEPDRWYAAPDPSQSPRRVIDLAPGDCVVAYAVPDPAGGYRIADLRSANGTVVPGPHGQPLKHMAVGMFGNLTRMDQDDLAQVAALLNEGASTYMPAIIRTPQGTKRPVWIFKGDDSPQPLNVSAMVRVSTVAYARTIIEHTTPTAKLRSPHDQDAIQTTPIHAVASENIARWRGWWLTLSQAGESDLEQDPNRHATEWPITITCTPPPAHTLPLRHKRHYWFRAWRTDIAGNIGINSLSLAARRVLEELEKSGEVVKRTAKPFQRPDAPNGPVLAQRGTDLGRPEFAFVGYTVRKEAESPGAFNPQGRLIIVTDRKGSQSTVGFASAWVLPPPAEVETVIASGSMDGWGGEYAKATIEQHEKYFDDGTLGRRTGGGLNYFPDPIVDKVRLRLTETVQKVLAISSVQPDRALEFFSAQNIWPRGATPRIVAASGAFNVQVTPSSAQVLLPPARTALLEIGPRPEEQGQGVNSELLITHATTGPLRPPKWIDLQQVDRRQPGDTTVGLSATISIDRPSTGAIRPQVAWNEFWDESVPALGRDAVAVARAASGKLVEIKIEDPGFGFGSQAVVHSITAPAAGGAVINATVKDGKLVGCSIVNGGRGYPGGQDIRVTFVRRPPLHTLAEAEATTVNGKIKSVTLKSRDNGFYATPPVVQVLDLKGTGYGASCQAVLGAFGNVVEIRVIEPGDYYSNDVLVGIFTDQSVLASRSIPDRVSPEAETQGDFDFDLSQFFGDTRARHLMLWAVADTRFQNEVLDAQQPMALPPRRFDVTSSARPSKPEIAYLLPSYEPIRWREAGVRRINERSSFIRCFLRRPWNGTGDEKLGVVVFNALENTSFQTPNPGANIENPIPKEFRKLVSRWGYDPGWDNNDYPPLTPDDLTNAVGVVRYDDLVESTGTERPPVSVVLHEVLYSLEKDLWYVDIGIRPPRHGIPFVQLAVVRYQTSSVDGLAISAVELADPIVHPASRRLEVERLVGGEFGFQLFGNFDGGPIKTPPNAGARQVFVELRRVLPDAGLEVEGPLIDGDKSIGTHSDSRWELQRNDDATAFAGKVRLENEAVSRPQDFYLAVKEFELFATAASYRDRTGTSQIEVKVKPGGANPSRAVFPRLVYFRRLPLTEVLQKGGNSSGPG